MPPRIQSAEEALARAEARGYKRGQFQEVDSTTDQKIYDEHTKKNHRSLLRRYILWWQGHHERECVTRGQPTPTEEDMRQLYLSKDVVVPDLTTMKDYVRFVAALGRGRIKKDDANPLGQSMKTRAGVSCVPHMSFPTALLTVSHSFSTVFFSFRSVA